MKAHEQAAVLIAQGSTIGDAATLTYPDAVREGIEGSLGVWFQALLEAHGQAYGDYEGQMGLFSDLGGEA